MGNALSVWSGRTSRATSVQDAMDAPNGSEPEESQASVEDESRVKAKEEEMAQFMKQLNAKREQRREILERHRAEKKELENSLNDERKAKLDSYETNKLLRELLIKNNIDIPDELQSAKEDKGISETIGNMKEEFERLRENNRKLRIDLAETNSSLQSAYSDIADLQGVNTESIKQISALKEVVSISKTMINLREEQITQLKNKLDEIEASLADREASTLSTDLRNEYVRQLQNMRTLRGLYEERARLAEVTKQSLIRDLEEQKALKEVEILKCADLQKKVDELEAKVEDLLNKVENKDSQISASEAETYGLKNEMTVVNKLFSQVLLGYKKKKDLDTLVHRLEENHDLLTHMAEKENGSEASTQLPKLLLELVSQVDEGEISKQENEERQETKTAAEESCDERVSTNTKAEEIVENLPKVWRVLIELLSHQSASAEENTTEKVTTCYKTVETKSGPVQVPSVSQTYIRLKDLIVEKLSLVKEVNRMKQLNTHLESRLDIQEKRLCLVTSELSKTWHVVGRLRRHHHQLHTHEKILKYELQQKRKLLNELKEELEYCREKWEQAREKNTESERDLKKLRAEFVSRKQIGTSFNTSAESGYSDERPSDDSSESNDESEYVVEPLARSKKKLKKSFEHILDSSADFNLVAEREDPASDLLDVAELPLDTHDSDITHDISDSCSSDNLLKSEKICEETEDELGDIANDSCIEEVAECSQNSSTSSNAITSKEQDAQESTSQCTVNITPTPTIDPAAILKSIKEQNERLARRDKRLEKLEKSGATLLKQTQNTAKVSEQLSDTLDHILNRPTSNNTEVFDSIVAKDEYDTNCSATKNENTSNLQTIEVETISKSVNNELIENTPTTSGRQDDNGVLLISPDTLEIDSTNNIGENDTTQTENTDTQESNSVLKCNTKSGDVIPTTSHEAPVSNASAVPNIDFKAILESVRKQDERLAKKEARMQTLEQSCAEVVTDISSTLNRGNEIIQRLDTVHEMYKEQNLDMDHAEHSANHVTQIDILTETRPYDDSETATTSNTNDPHDKTLNENLDAQEEIINKENDEEISTASSMYDKPENNEDREDSSEPSTSSEMDHEARFAARDRRLKRLEEQTKSLVSRVNQTTSKGVKINYKLEELHNIYGSENSRAGTPAEEDRSQHEDEENSEE